MTHNTKSEEEFINALNQIYNLKIAELKKDLQIEKTLCANMKDILEQRDNEITHLRNIILNLKETTSEVKSCNLNN